MSKIAYISAVVAVCIPLGIFAGPHEISTEKELDGHLQKGKPVVVKFYADWCGPCKQSKEPFKRIAMANDEQASFVAVNTKHKAPWISKYVKSGIPTFVVLTPDKSLVGSKAGYGGEAELRSWIEEKLAPHKKKK